MAYTGTGTQADPMIPTTITEFLQCLEDARNNVHHHVGTSGAVSLYDIGYYIKLESDIDCYDDPNYIGYTSKLDFGNSISQSTTEASTCAVIKLYADTNHYIRGLTVKDTTFFKLFDSNNLNQSYINNVNFIDCFFKPTTNSSNICQSVYTLISNCKISMNIYPYSNTLPTLSSAAQHYGTAFQNCSIYIKCNGGRNFGTSNYTLYGSMSGTGLATKNNVFVLENMPTIGGITNAYCLFNFSRGTTANTYNAIILKNPTISETKNFTFNSGMYNYMAIINPTISDSVTGNVQIGFYNCQYSIVAFPESSYTDHGGRISKTPAEGTATPAVMSYATLDQLKDVTYLTDIGFVP